MRQVPRSPHSFKLQRVANVPEHPPPSTRLMSCAHIANRRLSRIIGASEVGIQTDGTNLSSPESGGKFGGYRVQSFLTGLTPVPLSQGTIYVIKQSNPTYQALVYPMPTSHPCVNRLVLAADNTAGFWPAPTYALGRYQLDNHGFPMRD